MIAVVNKLLFFHFSHFFNKIFIRKYFKIKTKSRNRKLNVSLINYQILIVISIILYLAKEQGKSFYLKERCLCN